MTEEQLFESHLNRLVRTRTGFDAEEISVCRFGASFVTDNPQPWMNAFSKELNISSSAFIEDDGRTRYGMMITF